MADYILNSAWSNIDAVAAAYQSGALVEKGRLYNPTERDILPVSTKSDGSLWARSAMVYSFNSMSEYDEFINEDPDKIKNGDHVWIKSTGLNSANVYTLYLYFQQGLNKTVEIVSGASTESGEGNDTGKDAVIWYTNVGPSGKKFVISDLMGPAGAVPAPGHMIVSNYTGRGYFITAVDNDAVTIADYSVQVTGTNGVDGGYYTINVEQLNSQNVKISFTPSKEGMPTILPVVITLPQGPQGEPGDAYVLTEADKEEIAAMASPDATPDYVVEEAEAVIDRVLAAQGENTFTAAVITDLHDGAGGYTDGIKHACQAMKYIDSRVKLDAVAVLGDYTDGYPSTGIANAMGDFKAINGVLDKLRFTTNLRQQGNHDYYPDNIPITRQLIQYFSDGVVWGSRTGGYYHRDFEDHKFRVLCPNTNENNPMDTSTNKPSSSISMTEQQLRWFIDTLDLSAKSDADEWQILILTHHPLDYWESSGKYSLSYIVNAYQTGGSWSGNGVSCNFAGKNKAKLICNIHGHIHNLLMDQMFLGNSNSTSKIKVYRMATPNACYDRNNQYGGAWGEATTYSKTMNSGKDTAFVVYSIDLSAHKITAVCYGAGYDRVLNYLEETAPEIYTVTNHLTNVTSSNAAATVTEGQSYTATLTPAGGTIQSVTVTMGGVDVTASAYSNGVISISSVSGSIVITAVGTAAPTYTNQIPLSIDTDGNVYNGKGWKDDTRLNSSGAEAAATGVGITGFIPVKAGDVVYMKDVKADLTTTGGKNEYTYIALYNASFEPQICRKFNAIGSNMESLSYVYDNFTTDPTTGYVTSFHIVDRYNTIVGDGGYLRISAEGLNDSAIITVNQPIQ